MLQRFISLFEEGIDKNSQLCIYHKENKVVDIWGETPGFRGKDVKYGPDTLVAIFSSGKSIGSIMMGVLHDKGLIDFNEKIATYWPEFAQNGKENITIADVLKHEGQMEKFDAPMKAENNFTENLKKNLQGELIEKQAPHPLPHGCKRIYHGFTRDCITNEVFRRVEPEGQTMGEYFQKVIMPEYGIDVHLRMDPETIPKTLDFQDIGFMASMKNSWKDRDHQYSSVGFCGMCSYTSYYMSMAAEIDKTRAPGNRD